MTKVFTIFMLISIVTGCSTSPAPIEKNTDQDPAEKTFTPKILLSGDEPGQGIGVLIPKTIDATGPNAGKVNFTLVNWITSDEVFIRVTGYDSLWATVEGKSTNVPLNGDEVTLPNIAWSSVSVTVFPDNTNHYKRLHKASTSKPGERITCGCAIAWINSKIDVDRLESFIGGTADISLDVDGYMRSTGKSFSDSVSVKLKIIDPNAPVEDSDE